LKNSFNKRKNIKIIRVKLKKKTTENLIERKKKLQQKFQGSRIKNQTYEKLQLKN
jgi:hypothetical protein